MNLNCSKEKMLAGICSLFLMGYSPQVMAVSGNNPVPAEQQQTKKITGTVSDAQGPIIGASVVVKGTSTGVATDIDGNFTLNVKDGATIVVSYIGYVTQEIKVGNQNHYNITLKEDSESLDEVVVVGYGTMKKSDLTGSVSSVNTEQLNAKGATSVAANLQGAVAGVNITKSSGLAGGGFNIEVRGQSTMGKNNNPLYVVDGVICDDIDWLNPQDIEKIDILKDASSTAIYGSRATNGVVIVSTKTAKTQGGKAAKPTISYDGYIGFTKAVRMPDFMSGSEFSQFRFFRYLTPEGGMGAYGAQNDWTITQGNYKTALLTQLSYDADGKSYEDYTKSYIRGIINNGRETDWKDLGKNLKLMKKRMGEIDWNENIATQWMQTLKIMNDKDKGGKLPYFMQNPEWSKKDLNAALASWAELKHDAILYAKQPMGAECGGGGPPEPVVKGYVEPNVAFWKKAIELLDNTEKLLKSQNLLTEKISDATERMREEAKFLLQLSEKELAGEEASEEEYDQLKYIGATFENISLDLLREPKQILSGWTDVQGVDRKVAIVADVYTANADNNPNKSILFEAVGDADEIYVVVEIGGYLYLTRGAVLSYREFIQPIDKPRKTDEEWQKELESNPRKGVPEWMKRIIVPLNKMPEPNEEVFYSSGC